MKKFLYILGLLMTSGSFLEASHVVIMRHGQAEHNVENFRSSNPSHPRYRVSHLTKLGRAEVLKTAKALKQRGLSITHVYASPLPRTRETARIVMKELGIPHSNLLTDKRLTERQAGDLEGTHISYKRLNARVETRERMKARVQSFYRDLDDKQTILIVTHGIPATLLSQAITKKSSNLKTAGYIVASLKKQRAKLAAKSIRTLTTVKHLKSKKRSSRK